MLLMKLRMLPKALIGLGESLEDAFDTHKLLKEPSA